MNITDKIKTFFKEVWTEAKKVDWPSKKETFRYTLIVLGISMAVALFLGILDFAFVKILSKFVF
ncbi:MAG: preprotein translocase subunit SecE [Patescibacteria group bacterium]|nr:preprotein translocase subunit SecE [Patescibacteria group bacterium]